jgi:acetoin utilization protein AcuC
VEEIGLGEGQGFSANVPLWAGTDDGLYLRAFDEVVVPLVSAFEPDVVVTQLGVDTFHSDPLASLDLTTRGFERMLERMRRTFPRWVALGGGGYELLNVARAWTLAWAVMADKHIADEIPQEFRETSSRLGYGRATLRDEELRPGPRRDIAEEALEIVLRQLRRTVFPIHGL